MRNAAKYADSRMFAEAAGAARKAFKQKNAPVTFQCAEYEAQAEAENAKMGLGALYTAGGYAGEKEEDKRCAAEVAAAIADLERNYTLRYYTYVIHIYSAAAAAAAPIFSSSSSLFPFVIFSIFDVSPASQSLFLCVYPFFSFLSPSPPLTNHQSINQSVRWRRWLTV